MYPNKPHQFIPGNVIQPPDPLREASNKVMDLSNNMAHRYIGIYDLNIEEEWKSPGGINENAVLLLSKGQVEDARNTIRNALKDRLSQEQKTTLEELLSKHIILPPSLEKKK